MNQRADGRAWDELRPISVDFNAYGYAAGSVLFSCGKTKVQCSVTLQDGVPLFLRGKGRGWLTAEYALLPAATHTRTIREATLGKKNPRSVEISRLIGRCLRSIVDLSSFGERTIYVDCDVLQADGGTRSTSINAAYCALEQAIRYWRVQGLLKKSILLHSVGAISVGWRNGDVLLDIDYAEDSSIEADFNFVMTGAGDLVEVQGATESSPLPQQALEEMRLIAQQAIEKIVQKLQTFLPYIDSQSRERSVQ